jgi:transcriptional regulator with XRE-family HTH domain
MTTKKQTNKEKQNTVVKPNHKDEKFLREAYEKAGWSAGQIARECGVSREAVLFLLREFNIPITIRKQKSADAKSDYLNKTWLTAQLKKDVSIFRISKDQGVSHPEASGHESKLCWQVGERAEEVRGFSSRGKITGLTF